MVKLSYPASYLAIIALLGACGPREEILPGERLDLRGEETASENSAEVNRAVPLALPQPVNHQSWTHRNGTPLHLITHPALDTTLESVWTVDIGSGDERKYRITADPVVAGGRIFTLDARSTVTAVSESGQKLWSVSAVPAFGREGDASGGGLAATPDTVYVTTGYGTLTALDAQTGATRWTQRMDASVTGAPTVAGELVYVVARDGSAWAIERDNGRVAWTLPGTPTQAAMVGGAGPAVSDRLAIFPFSSGDMIASFPKGGVRLWSASVAGQRLGRVYAGVTDVTGDPVIDGDIVYGGTSSGRLAAIDARSGERLWTAREGAMSPVWPVSGSVFVISDQAELLRLDAETGERIWTTELPYFKNKRVRRRQGVHVHHGPVLAGGRLIVASSDGALRSYDPVNGALLSEVDLPGGATTSVAISNGTLYVVSSRGRLHAFR